VSLHKCTVYAQNDLRYLRPDERIGGPAFGEQSAQEGAAKIETLLRAVRAGFLVGDTAVAAAAKG
jgi:hypothetical protein